MKESYVANIKKSAKENDFFRKVMFTATKSQLVLMSLKPGEDIGSEVHDVDQILYVVDGEGDVVLDGVSQECKKGTIVVVPAGTQHNLINTDDEPLKLFTIYAPAEHPAGTVERTKQSAEVEGAKELEKEAGELEATEA